MSDMKLLPAAEWTDKDKERIDEFILSEDTNGEFIHSLKYLSYHPQGRFADDSVAVKDSGSGMIRCVVMACAEPDGDSVASHMGTTFAGPVIRIRDGYQTIRAAVQTALDYYEKRYKTVVLRVVPPFYGKQEPGILDYLLMQDGYRYGMAALANVVCIDRVKSEDDLFSMYDSKRRNHVKKPIKTGLFSFSRAKYVDRGIWEQMNQNLGNKFGSETTHSYDEITWLQQNMPGHIIPYEARTGDGEYAAFALIYKFKHVFHTQYLDVNYKFSGEYPNLYLVHNLLMEAARQGFRMFSFGASTEDEGRYLNEGLFAYKAGYGGGSILLPSYTKSEING